MSERLHEVKWFKNKYLLGNSLYEKTGIAIRAGVEAWKAADVIL